MMRQYTRKLAVMMQQASMRWKMISKVVEFHSKANALNDASMEMVSFAAEDLAGDYHS